MGSLHARALANFLFQRARRLRLVNLKEPYGVWTARTVDQVNSCMSMPQVLKIIFSGEWPSPASVSGWATNWINLQILSLTFEGVPPGVEYLPGHYHKLPQPSAFIY